MAPRCNDTACLFVVDFLGGGGGKDDGKIHSSMNQLFSSALVFIYLFLRMQLATCEPNFYSGWRRAAMIMIVDFL